MQTQEQTKQVLGEDVVQLIVFDLGKEEFGVKIVDIREIIETRNVTAIPNSPEFIKGLINVRGEIVATIDLRSRFFLKEEEGYKSKHIIITKQKENLFGLMVDEVTEVLRLPKANIKLAPEILTRTNREYVKGVVTLDNRLIILLDLEKVLSEEELMKLGELGRKHYKKIEETKSENWKKKDKFIEDEFIKAKLLEAELGKGELVDNGDKKIAKLEVEFGKDKIVDIDEKIPEMETIKKLKKQKNKKVTVPVA